MSPENHTLSLMAILLISVFVAIPYSLFFAGVDVLTGFAFSIFILGVLIDSLLTIAGLKLGGHEINPLYGFVKKYITNNQFVLVSTAMGIGIGIVLLLLFRSPFVILMFAMFVFAGPLLTSISLSQGVKNRS